LSSVPTIPGNGQSHQTVEQWIEFAQRVSICGRMVRDRLARLAARCQLSEPEFGVLWACREAHPAGLCQSELADSLAVSAAQVSGLVERLRRNGLLEGRRPAADRRRQHWRLTSQGRATLQTVLEHCHGRAGQPDSDDPILPLMRSLDSLAAAIRTSADDLRQTQQPSKDPNARTGSRNHHRRGAA